MLQIPAIQMLWMDPSPSEELFKDEGWVKTLADYEDFFEEWQRKKTTGIKMTIPEAMRSESAPASLDRAALIFTCSSCSFDYESTPLFGNRKQTGNALFGITEAQQHIWRCDWDADVTFSYSTIEFNERAGCAVRSLLELLELGEDALVKDMDAVNARIMCHGCLKSKSSGAMGGYAMTWRECVGPFFVGHVLGGV